MSVIVTVRPNIQFFTGLYIFYSEGNTEVSILLYLFILIYIWYLFLFVIASKPLANLTSHIENLIGILKKMSI